MWVCVALLKLFIADVAAGYWHETETVAGLFKIEELYPIDEHYFYVYLDDKRIYEFDAPYVQIKEKYDLKDNTLLLLGFGYGGAATTPKYAVVDIPKDKPPKMSELFFSISNVPTFAMKNKVIEIDLGFDSGLKKRAEYKNGQLRIWKHVVKEKEGDERSCRYMYDTLYKNYIRNNKCTRPFVEVTGLSSQRYLNGRSNDPRFNLEELYTLSEKSCIAQQSISYSNFKKEICTMKEKGQDE